MRNNGTLEELRTGMQQLDFEELQQNWRDKILILGYKRGHAFIDEAFSYAVDNWHPYNFGSKVKRIDYKTYEVTVSID